MEDNTMLKNYRSCFRASSIVSIFAAGFVFAAIPQIAGVFATVSSPVVLNIQEAFEGALAAIRPESKNTKDFNVTQETKDSQGYVSVFAGSPSIWNGGAIDDLWTRSANWAGNVPIPGTLWTVEFDGTTRLTPNNDFPSNSDFNNLNFNTGAGSFTLNGNPITMNGNLTNSSTSLQTINMGMVLPGTRTFTMHSGGGDVTIGDSGDSAKGVISGTGGGVTTAGTGTLTLWGNNSYTGPTKAANNTTIGIGNDSALGTGELTISGGSIMATGGARSIGNNVKISANDGIIGGSSDLTINGTITGAAASRTLTVSNSGLTTLSNVYLTDTATTRTFTVTGAGNVVFGGIIANNSTNNSTADNLTFNSAFSGTATINGTNTYSGLTTLSNGQFVLGNKSAFGNSTVAINGVNISANNDLSGVNSVGNSITFGGNNTFAGSNNIQFSGDVPDTGNRTVTNNITSGALKFSNSVGLSSNSNAFTLTVDGTGNTEVSGVIANNGTGGTAASGNLIKTGTGTLTLSNVCTYSGTTTVNNGKLFVNGSTASTSAVTVSGGTLGGTGTVNGTISVASGGKIAPGTSPGILNSGNVSFASGSTFDVEIGGTTVGTEYDQLNVTGTVSLGGSTLNLSVFNGFTPVSGQTFTIINNDSTEAVTGTFSGLAEGASIPNFLGSGKSAQITYKGPNGGANDNDVMLRVLYPTAADASIAGRVLTADGRAIAGAMIIVSGRGLEQPIVTMSKPSGRFVVRGLEAGHSYIVTVSSKRYVFREAGRLVNVTDNVSGLDWVALPK